MTKPLYSTTSYKGISGLENALISEISRSNLVVFGISDVQRLTGFSKQTAINVLISLTKKGFVVKLFRNKYCLEKKVVENSFAVAVNAFVPSYVSFWSALSFYGFTEQQINSIQIASIKQFKKIQLNEIVIQPVKIKPKNFYGYIELNDFVIALKEKALIDSALNFEYVGGFNEFTKCFKNAWSELNQKLFEKYLVKTNSKSLNSRVGFLIENLNLSVKKDFLEKLRKNSSKGFIKLNPSKKRSNSYNKKWKIIVNDSIEKGRIL